MKGMDKDMEIEKLQGAIEAILFTVGESVELGKIASVIGHDESTTKKIIHKNDHTMARNERIKEKYTNNTLTFYF